MWDPIYSQNIGLCGFRCRLTKTDGSPCTRVVRTQRGIIMHCRRVHGLVAQRELFDVEVRAEDQDGVMTPLAKEEKKHGKKSKASTDVELVRASIYDAADGEQLFRDSGSSTYRDPNN